MKFSRKTLVILVTLVLCAAFVGINGCKKSDVETGKTTGDSVELCANCGQIKGSALCCKPDQPKCSSCGLTKGSPGCCKIPHL